VSVEVKKKSMVALSSWATERGAPLYEEQNLAFLSETRVHSYAHCPVRKALQEGASLYGPNQRRIVPVEQFSVDPIKVREKGTSVKRGCHSCRVSPCKSQSGLFVSDASWRSVSRTLTQGLA
jgi:hypothetical protein